jgi:hypothetical protein
MATDIAYVGVLAVSSEGGGVDGNVIADEGVGEGDYAGPDRNEDEESGFPRSPGCDDAISNHVTDQA